MAIRLPGIAEEVDFKGLGSFLQNLVNPNYSRQQALREVILSGRVSPEDLEDTPEEVERIFGKGTGTLARGKKSAKKILGDYTGEQISEIIQLPDTDPRKVEFKARVAGTQTPVQRQIEGQQADIGKLTIEDKRDESTRSRDNRILAGQAALKVGGSDSLYANRDKFSPEELAAIRATKEFNESFESQRDDYWNQQRIELQRQIEGRVGSADNILKQQTAMLARQYADQADMSNPQDIMLLLNDHVLRKKYTDMKALPADADEADQRGFEAARAIEKAKARQQTIDDTKLWADFRAETRELRTAIRSGKLNDREKLAAVDEYNILAAKKLGQFLPPDEIPQIAYDKQGIRGARRFLPDEKTLYWKSGFDAGFGTDLGIGEKSDPLESYRGKSKAQIDAALALTDSVTKGKILQELLKAGIYK